MQREVWRLPVRSRAKWSTNIHYSYQPIKTVIVCYQILWVRRIVGSPDLDAPWLTRAPLGVCCDNPSSLKLCEKCESGGGRSVSAFRKWSAPCGWRCSGGQSRPSRSEED